MERVGKMELQKVASYTYAVEPAEVNAQGELPLTVLAQRILETATFHAESWAVGYSTLIQNNQAWVLARDRKSTRLNSSHASKSRMPSSA